MTDGDAAVTAAVPTPLCTSTLHHSALFIYSLFTAIKVVKHPRSRLRQETNFHCFNRIDSCTYFNSIHHIIYRSYIYKAALCAL